jgi:hypothetical protein
MRRKLSMVIGVFIDAYITPFTYALFQTNFHAKILERNVYVGWSKLVLCIVENTFMSYKVFYLFTHCLPRNK